MSTHDRDAVRQHYEAAITDQDALMARITAALDALPGPLTAQRLASFDQFHIGGLAASIELARRLDIGPETRVLDAGSGLGGPSRYLAETFGCQVAGVDVAPTYIAIAQLLAERSGLSNQATYSVASITDLPFADASFDLVWTQHVVMNIPDRAGLYREMRRVLKPGGQFAFFDPYVPASGAPPHYPTPWAETADQSTLLTEAETRTVCAQAGFEVVFWDDVSELGKAWITRQQQQLQQLAASAEDATLSPRWVVGPRMQPMVANFARNIQEGRIQLAMGLCEAI